MAAAALASKDGGKRWVVSSFGFRATVIGPFSGSKIVDCDHAGLIDLKAIERLGAESFDAIIATNPFGMLGNMDGAVDFARRLEKSIILDNAAAFVGFDRANHGGVFECLSFHHTKPFGFGEGGCLILDRTLEDDCKSALDFGYHGEWSNAHSALSNGKMSDSAAAFILARHRDYDAWIVEYHRQFNRILKIGERMGYRLLMNRDLVGAGACGNVPLICSEPISSEQIRNGKLVFRKYYKPLGEGTISHHLYDRVVNIPCHPGVGILSDAQIEDLLAMCRRTPSAV